MPKYRVTLYETIEHSYDIEAATEEEAFDLSQAEDREKYKVHKALCGETFDPDIEIIS